MKVLVTGFMNDESGATAIEYGLIAACIAIAIIAAVKGVATNLNSTFNNVSTNLRYGHGDRAAAMAPEIRSHSARWLAPQSPAAAVCP